MDEEENSESQVQVSGSGYTAFPSGAIHRLLNELQSA